MKNLFNDELNEGIDHYFEYLENEEYGFFLDNPESFPSLDLTWESPLKVNNAILEINENCDYDFKAAIKELSSLGCASLQIRINASNTNEIMSEILDATRFSRIKGVELFLPEFLFDSSLIKHLEDIENRISIILVHGVENEEFANEQYGDFKYHKEKMLVFTSKIINSSTTDIIAKEKFITNIDFFSEAHRYNVALNRKVCIDNKGNFKNFLSHADTYGNFKDRRIADLIEDKAFIRKWFVNNDNIEVCKDCQFRYICMDNSDIEFNGSSWEKVNQCPFDPYTNEWRL
ncbi:grasp-with-spasm system SPASM domain peptide maturase [Chryseobacterium wanjuense]